MGKKLHIKLLLNIYSADPGSNSGTASANDSGFHAVAFLYGNTEESVDQKADDAEPGFQPPFHVPEGLLQNLV